MNSSLFHLPVETTKPTGLSPVLCQETDGQIQTLWIISYKDWISNLKKKTETNNNYTRTKHFETIKKKTEWKKTNKENEKYNTTISLNSSWSQSFDHEAFSRYNSMTVRLSSCSQFRPCSYTELRCYTNMPLDFMDKCPVRISWGNVCYAMENMQYEM